VPSVNWTAWHTRPHCGHGNREPAREPRRRSTRRRSKSISLRTTRHGGSSCNASSKSCFMLRTGMPSVTDRAWYPPDSRELGREPDEVRALPPRAIPLRLWSGSGGLSTAARHSAAASGRFAMIQEPVRSRVDVNDSRLQLSISGLVAKRAAWLRRLVADSCTAAWWRGRCDQGSLVALEGRRRWPGGVSRRCGAVCGG